jgi:hypothetical protein
VKSPQFRPIRLELLAGHSGTAREDQIRSFEARRRVGSAERSGKHTPTRRRPVASASSFCKIAIKLPALAADTCS